MKKYVILVLIGIIITLRLFNNNNNNNIIYVQAASSLQAPLNEIKDNFEAVNYDVQINYGGSGMLVTQIQEGAPADIFISASSVNFDNLAKTNNIIDNKTLLTNELVIIKNKNSNINTLDDVKRIAIGTPDVVPAGTYGKEALEYYDVYDKVENKLVMTKDVKEAVTYVETNNVDLAIVYKSDSMLCQDCQVVYSVPNQAHSEIVYPIGLLSQTTQARDFYDYLNSSSSAQIFEKYGFDIYE